ncbi:hypothetical protein DY000_02014276 [Brassica cretica]|uniref:Uncharacterized protein n=1 Tax=Brassica cretica TaxID=69181 RepID=A0ABQ7CNI9_BRACR|nr:hypothetical protein DY000_02014276 [Brassica cretica]
MEIFHIRKYGRFPLSAICLFLELEAVPGTDIGVLDTGDPERFWNGDPEIRILPGARRKMIPEYFSPTVCPLFPILSSISANNLCTQVNRGCSFSAGIPRAGQHSRSSYFGFFVG